MELRNNNGQAVKILARRSRQYYKFRDRILMWSAAAVVMIVFCVLSFAAGRIETDSLEAKRLSGSATCFTLAEPTEKQYELIKNLSYVTAVEREWNLGTGVIQDAPVFFCTYIGEKGFDQFYKPAFTQVTGTYPEKKNEIMLPVSVLDELGVKKPAVGMKLKLSIKEEKRIHEKQFVLSGYFTGYFQVMNNQSVTSFVSRQYGKDRQGERQDPYMLRFQTSNMPHDDDQQKEVLTKLENHTGIRNIEGYFDGIITRGLVYGQAAVLIMVMLICGILLVHNVTSIFICKDIACYSLLKTLGASQRQIKAVILRQALTAAGKGIVIGIAVGCLVVLLVIPWILENVYLIDVGPANPFIGFRPLLLIFSILLTLAAVIISALGPARKVALCSPVEAQDYMEVLHVKRTVVTTRKGNRLYRQAWRAVFYNKKKAILTIFSLALGVIAVLSGVMIIDGYESRINETTDVDFQVYGLYFPGQIEEETALLDHETITAIKAVPGVEKVKIHRVGFMRLNGTEKVWKPRTDEDTMYGGAVLVDDNYIDQLETYAAKNKLNIDIAGLRAGTGAIEVHGNELTGREEERANRQIGSTFTVEQNDGGVSGKMIFSGYLNRAAKGFPEIKMVMHSAHDPILMMTAKGFQRAGIRPLVDELLITADKKVEPEIKRRLETIVYHRDKALYQKTGETNNVSLYATSDDERYDHQRMTAMKVMAYGITLMLFLMGILNYFNVFSTGLIHRKNELAMLECLGMTRRELRRMLILEGCWYSGMATVISALAGGPIIWLLAEMIKKQAYDFRLFYPWGTFVGMIGILFLMSVVIPLILYQVEEKESVIWRLRDAE